MEQSNYGRRVAALSNARLRKSARFFAEGACEERAGVDGGAVCAERRGSVGNRAPVGEEGRTAMRSVRGGPAEVVAVASLSRAEGVGCGFDAEGWKVADEHATPRGFGSAVSGSVEGGFAVAMTMSENREFCVG